MRKVFKQIKIITLILLVVFVFLNFSSSQIKASSHQMFLYIYRDQINAKHLMYVLYGDPYDISNQSSKIVFGPFPIAGPQPGFIESNKVPFDTVYYLSKYPWLPIDRDGHLYTVPFPQFQENAGCTGEYSNEMVEMTYPILIKGTPSMGINIHSYNECRNFNPYNLEKREVSHGCWVLRLDHARLIFKLAETDMPIRYGNIMMLINKKTRMDVKLLVQSGILKGKKLKSDTHNNQKLKSENDKITNHQENFDKKYRLKIFFGQMKESISQSNYN